MKNFAVCAFVALFAVLSGFATIAALSTTSQITFAPSASIAQFGTATANSHTIDINSSPVNGGVAYLQLAVDSSGYPTTCALADHYTFAGGPTAVASGNASFPLNTNVPGTLGYAIYYAPSGAPYHSSHSPCADFTVTPVCSGVQIAADSAGGFGNPSPGYPHDWEIEIKVHACQAATGLKVQGGMNPWTVTSVGTPSVGVTSVKSPGKSNNAVIAWTIDSLDAGEDATLLLTVSGTVKPKTKSGTVLGLLGPWSVLYSIDGGSTYQKSDYTGSITVTVN